MRVHVLPALLVIITSAGCDTNAGRNPVAPADVSAATAQRADEAQIKRINGTLEAVEIGAPQPGNPIVVRRLTGEGKASHLGRFTTVADFTLNLITATGGGTATYTAANGDELFASVVGRATLAAGIATVNENVTVTGGTGRFAGATGKLAVVRRLIQATGVSTGTLDGVIVLPR